MRRPQHPVGADAGRLGRVDVAADGVQGPAERVKPSRTMPTANSGRHSQIEAGTPNHGLAEVEHRRRQLEEGLAAGEAVSRPRSTISMPSVTMKPLSPNRTISSR